MPDIDPAALSRTDPIIAAVPSSLSLSKVNGASSLPSQKAFKTTSLAQRIELEPLYTNLKAAIGDNWGKYKESISLFVLGALNQSELSFRIDHFVTAHPNIEHLHNQLIAGIYGNVSRDSPEPGVAPWVSANDKPTVVSKPVSGDAAEQRLKTEIMQLPGRERRRLKEIPNGETHDNISHISRGAMNDYRAAKTIKIPDHVPVSAGGLNKTNWDLEIRKRYSQPLASETGEFPDTDSIHNRMMPICYEESLLGGCHPSCAEYMATATEQFLKQVVSGIVSRTRSNIVAGGAGGHTIMTRRYRQLLNHEEAAAEKSQLVRAPMSNLLPVEAKEAASRRPLGMGDFRVALSVGNCALAQMPIVINDVMGGWPEGVLEGYGRQPEVRHEEVDTGVEGSRTNGIIVNGNHVNGITHKDTNESTGWYGSGDEDQEQLFSVLDDCLAIGQ